GQGLREQAQVGIGERARPGAQAAERGARRVDGAEVGDVVGQRVPGPQRGPSVAGEVPGQAQARSEVVLVRLVELIHALQPAVGEEVRLYVVLLVQRLVDVPATSRADGQARGELDVVVDVERVRVLEQVAD